MAYRSSDVSPISPERLKGVRVRASLVVLAIFIGCNVVDMGGGLGLKYLGFALAAGMAVINLTQLHLSTAELLFGGYVFALWPTFELIHGFAIGADRSLAVTQVTSFVSAPLLMALTAQLPSRLPIRIFYRAIGLIVPLTLMLFVGLLLAPDNVVISSVMDMVSSDESFGYFGARELGETVLPNVYFRSTLFLVPAFVYFLISRRYIVSLAIFFSLLVTMTKAGILACACAATVHALLHRSGNGAADLIRRVGFVVVLVLGAVVTITAFQSYATEIKDTVRGESDTSVIRIRHIESVQRLFSDHPQYLLYGQGAGATFFSTGESAEVDNIEVDHLNAIRKFGFPWFVAYSAIVAISAYRCLRRADTEAVACGLALVFMYIVAGTNPVLLSPLFVILLVCCHQIGRDNTYVPES